MDELKIYSKFTTELVGKILRRVIKAKTGSDVDISINSLTVNVGESIRASCNMDVDISKKELLKLLQI